MQISNMTPFKVMPCPGFDPQGHEIVSVIVKGTFNLPERGKAEASVPDEQVEIVMADEYWGQPGKSPTKLESDLAPFKPGTDVILLGSARAFDGRPARSFDVSIAIGTKSKKRSFYYWSKRNDLPLHTIDWRLNQEKEKWEVQKAPKDGFGFFPKVTAPRVHYAGTYDAHWQKTECPFLPKDFDHRFFQAAYPDLICHPQLRGNEYVRVTGMSPGSGIEAVLPGIGIEIEAFIKKDRVKASPNPDTVVVEPTERRVVLVWRAVFRINGPPSDVQGFVTKMAPLPK
jgi:hypothetical protein